MRFTKIPLIATLMAVALSLLIVLPTIAQSSNITDGRGGTGVVKVGVFDDIEDAQAIKLMRSEFDFQADEVPSPWPYIPIANPSADIGDTEGELTAGTTPSAADEAYLADRRVDPQNTFFQSTLYVSNNVDAFNTVVVNVDTSGVADYDNTCEQVDNDDGPDAVVTATVRNNRNGDTITMELVRTDGGHNQHSVDADGTEGADGADYAQAIFKVVESGDTGTYDPTPSVTTNDDARELPFRQFGGPTWCASDAQRDYDPTPEDTDNTDEEMVDLETAATSAVYGPVPLPGIGLPLAGDAPSAQQEIATIFARHGDRLTVTTSAGSGSAELTVDGDGPEFTAITPEDNDVMRPSRLAYSFEVRDDDSGLRHDGEAQLTEDDDYEEINPDDDQHLESEPLSEDPAAAVPANGPAADIDVNIATNTRNGTTLDYGDISASGTWSIAGSRAGVAYAFTASGADKDDGYYAYQLEATDRAGNKTVTDAEDDRDVPGDQPFVFRVDDTDPDLGEAVRTGISWDSENNEEEVDRSYIALDFGDALGDVDTGNITVVGHTIVGYIHPSAAPRINRGEAMATVPETVNVPPEPAATRPTATEPSVDAPTAFDRSYIDDTAVLGATILNRQPSLPVDCRPTAGFGATLDLNEIVIPDPDDDDCAAWKSWMVYEMAVNNQRTWDTQNAAYKAYTDNKAQYEAEHPGVNIEGNRITEPRAVVYIELAEDLASDETPTVQVVGGAVYDLAGNTNGAETLNEAQDWIAPKLTVTVTGTAADRQVSNAEDSFTVDVTADEDVSRPRVFFVALSAALNSDKDGYDYSIGPADDGTNEGNSLTAQEDENHWNRRYRVSSGDLSEFDDGLVGVIVFTDDDEDNSGATAGWTPGSHRNAVAPTPGNKLNLSKMDDASLLVEIDRIVKVTEDDDAFVTPRSDAEGTETESANPFVKLDFSTEGGEYQVCPEEDADGNEFKCGRANDPDTTEKRVNSRRGVQGLALPGQRGRDYGERRGRTDRPGAHRLERVLAGAARPGGWRVQGLVRGDGRRGQRVGRGQLHLRGVPAYAVRGRRDAGLEPDLAAGGRRWSLR